GLSADQERVDQQRGGWRRQPVRHEDGVEQLAPSASEAIEGHARHSRVPFIYRGTARRTSDAAVETVLVDHADLAGRQPAARADPEEAFTGRVVADNRLVDPAAPSARIRH